MPQPPLAVLTTFSLALVAAVAGCPKVGGGLPTLPKGTPTPQPDITFTGQVTANGQPMILAPVFVFTAGLDPSDIYGNLLSLDSGAAGARIGPPGAVTGLDGRFTIVRQGGLLGDQGFFDVVGALPRAYVVVTFGLSGARALAVCAGTATQYQINDLKLWDEVQPPASNAETGDLTMAWTLPAADTSASAELKLNGWPIWAKKGDGLNITTAPGYVLAGLGGKLQASIASSNALQGKDPKATAIATRAWWAPERTVDVSEAAAPRLLAIKAATDDKGTSYPRLIDRQWNGPKPGPTPSPTPSGFKPTPTPRPTMTPKPRSTPIPPKPSPKPLPALLLDLGEAKALDHLVLYRTNAVDVEVSLTDDPKAKGTPVAGKPLDTDYELKGVKARYVRLAGKAFVAWDEALQEVRLVAPAPPATPAPTPTPGI